MDQLKDTWGTTKGKITILRGSGLVGLLSLCLLWFICSVLGRLNNSQQVTNSQPIEQSSLSIVTPTISELIEPTEISFSTAIPTPTATPKPTSTSLPTATPEPTPTSDPCTMKVKQEGRNEPEYVGLQGYLKASSSDLLGYDKFLPAYPWQVPILSQIGPQLWEKGDETILAKTPIVVLEQHLKHEGYGRYTGDLVVKSLENPEEYRIDIYNFTPTDYWNCPPQQAVKYSNFIARVKEGVKPINRAGEWVEIGEQKEVFCNGTPGLERDDLVKNGVECHLYKNYINGFGGVGHLFPADSLEIVY